MTATQLTATRSGYLRKLRVSEWRSWLRLLTFRSDYRMMARAMLKPIGARFGRAKPRPSAAETAPADNTNPLFAPAFRAMVASSRPVLLVFAESDRLFWEFEDKFMQRHASSLAPYATWYRVHVTPLANHIFSASEWQEDLFAQCGAWLEEMASKTGEHATVSAR
jgi:hypothetical protein